MLYYYDLKGVIILPLKMKRFENIQKMVEIMIAVILLDIASSQVSLSDNANFDWSLAVFYFYSITKKTSYSY